MWGRMCRLVVSLAIFSLTMAGTAIGSESRPNILIVVSDDMGWGQPGFNGGTEVGTPNLDRIANEGVKLTQFYVSPSCSPTRSALLTGRYHWKTGGVAQRATRGTTVGMLLDERTMAEALRDAGYRTWAIGKWHLGKWHLDHLPLQRGFDHHYGTYSGSIGYYPHHHNGVLDWHRNGRPVVEHGYSTFLMAEEAVQLIGRHDARDPFFLYLAFNAPHLPKGAPDEYVERYPNAEDPTQPAQLKALDDALGWVLDALESKGILDDTLVVYLNDNGGPSRAGGNAPYRGLKGSFHEGGIRVPAAMRWPGHIPERSESDALLHVVDVFPTLAELARASTTDGLPLDGLDAWPAIADGAESPRRELAHSLKVMRVGDWKLLETDGVSYGGNHNSPLQLYNIAEDPYEETNLAARESVKVEELRARLAAHREGARRAAPRSTLPEGLIVFGRDENTAYGAAVERTVAAMEAGNTGPTMLGFEASGYVATLRFSEGLDTTSVPLPDSFRVVKVPEYETIDIKEVEVNGNDVQLTMPQKPVPGETLGLTYDVPDDGAIRDLDRFDAVGITWVTTTVSSIDPVWSSTVTVGVQDEFRGYSSLPKTDLGAVDDHTFELWVGYPYQVQIVLACSDGVIFQVRSRGASISDLILEWMGYTFPLDEAEWDASWDRYTWSQSWLDVNAPMLNASSYTTTLSEGDRAVVCLRSVEQTCPYVPSPPLEKPVTASDDATLSSLTLSGVDIGTFAAGTVSYSATVGHDVSSTQVTATANDAGATVTITDADGSTSGSSRSSTLNVGSNTITVTVTAEDGSSNSTYTVTVTRETTALVSASDDATLASLTLSGVDIGTFAAGTVSYSATVGHNVSSTQVTATANNASATVTIADADGSTSGSSRSISLNDGSNTITVTVTAEDGSTTVTYTVTVTRETAEPVTASDDATLSSLTLSGVDIGTFAAGTVSYSATVGHDVSSTQVTATANHVGATVTIADADGSTSGSSRLTALYMGSNTITVTVTAEDGRTTVTYTVTVTLTASDDASLSSLTLSSVDIGTFAAGTVSYSATVEHNVSSTQVTATANDVSATVTITDADGSTSGSSRSSSLIVGSNTITVTVTAEDATTTVTYTVTVTRATLPPLAAEFKSAPRSHDGTSEFTFHLSFSDRITANLGVLQDQVLSASGGSVIETRRVNGRNDLWQIHVKPSDNVVVTVTLNPTTDDCSQSGSICTADGRALSNSPSVTVTERRSLTASFASVPASHDGKREFTLQLSFNDNITTTVRVLRAQALSATGGVVTNAWRVDGRNDLWLVYVKPSGNDAITVTLDPPTDDCSETGSVCTADGRALTNSPSETVDGPPTVGASVNGTIVTLSWDRPRDDFGSPTVRDYGVRVNGQARSVVSAELSGTRAWIMLVSPVSPGDEVSVAYFGSAMHPLAEAAGHLRSGPWDGLVARNITGVEPLEARVGFANTRSTNFWEHHNLDAVQLDGSELGLSQIWEVERFTELERLDLSGNSITNVSPLAGLVNLRVLDLSNNQVSNLWSLSGLYNLERLNLSGNKVIDVQALAWLPNLKVLLLDRNDITDMWPLAGSMKLENVGLRENKIRDVSALQDLPELRRLDLTGNPTVDISPLGDIESLVWLALPAGRSNTSTQTLWRLPQLDWVWFGGVGVRRHEIFMLQ